jgi:uncharacterized protein YabN with tetrapyrrole methylase and pyrophosphatase domain
MVEQVLPFDIGIVGLGIVGAHQMTREAEGVIRRSKSTFVIQSGVGITRYLETLCPKVTNLGPLYEPGKSRLPTYRKMAAAVVTAALEEPPVCFAAYGHPFVYCYPTTLITRAAQALDLKVEVLPGVSSFDTLLVDLQMDLAFDGIQMYEATDLLLRNRPLQEDVTAVIWQPTVVGDPTYPENPRTAEQFQPLQDHLMRFYPPDHAVSIVMSKTFPLLESSVRTFPLNRLAVELEKAPQVGTLFIRPVRSRPVENRELLDRMLALEPRRDSPPTSPRPGRPVVGPQPE